MLRIGLGVISGLLCWVILWVGSEKLLSASWPEGYGAHQLAFEEAIINGGQFTADTTLLLTHIVVGSIVSVLSGLLAALVAGENRRAPLVLGLLLLALGMLKAAMSWQYVPIWYHLIFTAMPVPMAVMGGKLGRNTRNKTKAQEVS